MRTYLALTSQFSKLLSCSVLVFSSSCASLQITTDPVTADIVALSPAGGTALPLGKSPVSLNSDKLSEILRKGPALIRASADGYESASLLLPTSLRGDLKASLNLKKVPENPNNKDKIPGELNTLVRDVLDAERGIIEKRYDDAQRLALKIRDKFPALAVSYFLEGSIQFQKGDVQAALASLNRGVELDPDDMVTRNFIEQIRKNQTPKTN